MADSRTGIDFRTAPLCPTGFAEAIETAHSLNRFQRGVQ
jgi:hypothetical protein